MLRLLAAAVILAGNAGQIARAAPDGPPAADHPPTIADRTMATDPAPTPAPVTAAKPAAEPRICRTSIETGSLIAKHKQCLTKAQWRYVDDAHETEARRLMQDNMNRPGCNGPAC
jgi:hypothetical protein